jgi:hypothetical protein
VQGKIFLNSPISVFSKSSIAFKITIVERGVGEVERREERGRERESDSGKVREKDRETEI